MSKFLIIYISCSLQALLRMDKRKHRTERLQIVEDLMQEVCMGAVHAYACTCTSFVHTGFVLVQLYTGFVHVQ